MTSNDTKAPAIRQTKGGVQSVERAFGLLECIANSSGSATLSHIAAEVSLPLPTIHRLLNTLVNLGVVRQLPNRGYALGPGLIRLGNLAGAQLGAIARPYLRTLVDELGESANVATIDGDMVVYVDQVASQHQMRMFTEVGRRAHMHDTGVGKAMLAGLDSEQVRHIVTTAGMPTPTQYSIGTVDDLETELERIRDRGYSIDEQEQELGVRCFAMSIPEAPAPLAISVSGPISRVDKAFSDRAIPLLRSAAEAISDDMRRSA